MSWYTTGTIAVTNGSTTITGTGTAFVANVQKGFAFLGPDYSVYEIASITSDTVAVLTKVYRGTTASAQAYGIFQTQGIISDLSNQVATLLSTFGPLRTAFPAILAGTQGTAKTFVTGTDFTPGTTTSLTLSQTYTSTNQFNLFFDSAFQGPDQFTIAGSPSVATFTSAIPIGVVNVYERGGTPLGIGTPSDTSVTVPKLAADTLSYFTRASNLLSSIGSSLVGWIQSGSGAVARLVQDKLRETVGFKDFGAKGDTREMLDGAITTGTGTLISATAGFTSSDIGKLASIKGAGVGGQTLVGTITGVTNSTTATLSVNASATVSGMIVFVGSDDTAAINATIAAVRSTLKAEQLMNFGGRSISMEAGNFSITTPVYVPLNVNIEGRGTSVSMFTCMNATAGITLDDRDGTNGQGGYLNKLSINGNDLTTADVLYIGTRVMMTFDHIAVGYGWGNGMSLVNTQNCVFNLLEIRACGNTTTGTGKNLVIKNGSAGNVFIRPEINEATQRHISFEDDFNTNTSGNVFIGGLCEYWKGKFDATPKPNFLTEFVYANFRGAGGIANEFQSFAFSTNSMTTFSGAVINFAQGGIAPLVFTNPVFDGDSSALATVFKLRSGGGLTLIEISGSMFVRNYATLFDTAANTGVEDKSYYFPLNVGTVYSATDSVLVDDRINATFYNRIYSRSGQYGFPIVQIPSANATVLDDYREGTYSPVLTFGGSSAGVSYSYSTGKYIKIGKKVSVDIDLVLTSKGSSTGAVAVSLPFTAGSNSVGAFGPCRGLTLTTGKYPNGQTVSGQNTYGLTQTDFVSSESTLTDANLSGTTRIFMTLTYEANQ